MRWVGFKSVPIKSLILPGRVAQRMAAPDVRLLADSYDATGGEPGNVPWVDAKSKKLIAGCDRIAALKLRKAKNVTVRLGTDWTPADMLKAEIYENLHRRHDDKAALTKALVDKAEAIVLGQASGKSAEQREAHRPKTTRTQAREIVAEASGVTVESVRKADERAKARDEGPAGSRAAGASVAPPAPLIEARGHELPDHVRTTVEPIVKALARLDKQLRAMQSEVTGGALFNMQPGIVSRIKDGLHDLAALIRFEIPDQLCPKCKGKSRPLTGPFCPMCMELGAVTKAQFEAAPRDSGKDAAASGHGAQREAATGPLSPSETPAPPRPTGTKPKKGIKVEYQGETLTLEEFERRAGEAT